MTESNTDARYHVLDGLRGVAAVSVMLGHFVSAEFRILGHPIVPFTQSSLAVDLFFMLSGFVLSHAYADRIAQGMPLRLLMIKRFIRLYPLFITGLLLGGITLVLLIWSGLTTLNADRAGASFGVNLFFLPYLAHETIRDLASGAPLVAPIFPANPPAWSLFFEMLASLALPWLIRQRTRPLMILIALAWIGYVASGFIAGLPNDKIGFNPSIGWNADDFGGGFFRTGFGFITGIVLYRLTPMLAPIIRARAPAILFNPWILYALAFALLVNPFAARGAITMLTLLVAMPFLVTVGAMTEPKPGIALKTSVFLGYLSYPLYCLHYPIGRLAALATQDLHLSTEAFTLLAGGLAFAAALLAAAFIDRPVRRALALRAARRQGPLGPVRENKA